MNAWHIVRGSTALALVSMLAACSTWHSMDQTEKGTAVGATGGAVVGAAVGGPVGAAVGAGVGGYTGHYEAPAVAKATGENGSSTSGVQSGLAESSPTVRSAQEALNAKGYDAGTADGVVGPNTESAVRQFQQAQGLPQTGNLDQQTLSALGVSQQGDGRMSSTPASSTSASADATSKTQARSIANNDRNETRSQQSDMSGTQNGSDMAGTQSAGSSFTQNSDVAGTQNGDSSLQNSATVRSAQEALNAKGYDAGTADGVMGPNTKNAVRQFQQAQGLPQTGELDSQTVSALGVSQQSEDRVSPSARTSADIPNASVNNGTHKTAGNSSEMKTK